MASPVDTSVKFMHSGMVGAPVLSGTAGSLLSLLDAFLVNGFGVKVVESAVIANGVCRLGFNSGASAADPNAVILVTGATPADLNGEQKVTAVSDTWVEFKTDLPDGAVTGSVSFKLAPLGWEKVFTKTNVAVYRPTDVKSTRFFLRVNDTNALAARVNIYESMTTVDAGTGMMPAAAVMSGGYYWNKREASTNQGCKWLLVGDSMMVMLFAIQGHDAAAAGGAYTGFVAGDLNSYRSGDAWGCMLTGSPSGWSYSYGSPFSGFNLDSTFTALMRRAHGVGSAVSATRYLGGHSGISGDLSSPLGSVNHAVDNTMRTTPVLISDGPSFEQYGVRGVIPGAQVCLNSNAAEVFGVTLGQTQGAADFKDRTYLSIPVGHDWTVPAGVGLLDITGPWRD